MSVVALGFGTVITHGDPRMFYGHFDDDMGFDDMPSNSLAAEYRFMETGLWANADESVCPCRGTGYCLSDLDTWHRCPIHYHGQRHPEDYRGEDAEPANPSPPPPPRPVQSPRYADDEIPF